MKVAVNRCYGGFGLSAEALLLLIERKSVLIRESPLSEWQTYVAGSSRDMRNGYKCFTGISDGPIFKDDVVYSYDRSYEDQERAHDDLITVIEELGTDKASGRFASLEIVEVPDDVEWELDEYDGMEHVAEKHRTW